MTEKKRGQIKTKIGTVVSNKMAKTIIVSITTKKKDPDFGKYVKRTNKYFAHDEKNECKIGDLVEISESRRLSKNKNWRVTKIVEKAAE
jgi:small subunit ribosomal protein S17